MRQGRNNISFEVLFFFSYFLQDATLVIYNSNEKLFT